MARNWHPVPLHNRDMVDLLPGTVLSGHFVLGGPVVRSADGGGLWRATDVATCQAVMVKILTARPADDTLAQARFRLTARALAGLSGPGIAPVRECGEFISPGGPVCPYVIRDLVPGPALAQRLLRGPLPADEALRVVVAVAEVLAAAHRAGLAHGNLGPHNIILGEPGVQVTDFGLSPLRDQPPGPDPYRAPELAAGAPFTPAADIYSLGVLLVACLSGMEAGPAGAAGAGQLVLSPGEAAEFGPPALSALMGACLSARPQDRPGAAHVAVMSRQALGGGIVAPGDQVVQFDADPAADTAPLPAWTAALAGSPGEPAGRGVPARPARLAPARRPGAGRFWPHAFAPGAAAATVLVLALVAGVLALGRLHMMGSSVTAVPRTAPTASASAAGPQPMATAASVMALAAVRNLAQTVSRDVTNGMIRPDVGVDFGNFIRPVEADLLAGEPAGVRQLAATLRDKLAQRANEDAVTPEAARAIAAELNTLRAAPGT
jgi:serine/threonine-protein kinase